MRCIIDIRHLTKPSPSGVGQYTTELLKALFLLDKKNEYYLLSSGTTRAKTNLPVFDYPNVKNLHIKVPNKVLNLCLLGVNQPQFDRLVVDTFGPTEKTVFFFPNLNIISLSAGTPYFLTIHDLSFSVFPHLYEKKMRLWHYLTKAESLAQGAQAIIVPSQSAANDLKTIFNISPERLHIIPHGVSSKFSNKSEPQDHGIKSRYRLPKRFALFVGTLESRKNIETLIKAVEEYRSTTKDDLALVLVGKPTSYSEKILKKINQKQKDFIFSLGYCRPQDLPALYRLATVTLFPSLYEGFGLPIIESMACGTPVITSRTSAMPEIGGRAALYINPYNHRDISTALRELLSSEDLQKQKKAAGLEQIKKFSWEESAKKTLEVLEKISIS